MKPIPAGMYACNLLVNSRMGVCVNVALYHSLTTYSVFVSLLCQQLIAQGKSRTLSYHSSQRFTAHFALLQSLSQPSCRYVYEEDICCIRLPRSAFSSLVFYICRNYIWQSLQYINHTVLLSSFINEHTDESTQNWSLMPNRRLVFNRSVVFTLTHTSIDVVVIHEEKKNSLLRRNVRYWLSSWLIPFTVCRRGDCEKEEEGAQRDKERRDERDMKRQIVECDFVNTARTSAIRVEVSRSNLSNHVTPFCMKFA